MEITFNKAVRKGAPLRLCISGVSGSGKTWTFLSFATSLAKLFEAQDGRKRRIVGIDTERGSMRKYATDFDFDVFELGPPYDPRRYMEVIRAADEAGYDFIIVDSLSHAWSGTGGELEMVENAKARSGSGNSYTAWRSVTPIHNELVDTLLSTKANMFVTLRAKTEYVQEKDERGKASVRKVGLAPIQRDGLEYEFDLVADMDVENTFAVSKTRIKTMNGLVKNKPGLAVAQMFFDWYNEVPAEKEIPVTPVPAPVKAKTDAPPPPNENATAVINAIKDKFGAVEVGTVGTETLKAYPDKKAALIELVKKRGYTSKTIAPLLKSDLGYPNFDSIALHLFENAMAWAANLPDATNER